MTRPSVRNALLGLLDQVPLVGSGAVRTLEDHWPSRREREQAAVIAAQAVLIEELQSKLLGHNEQIGELEYQLEHADADRRMRERYGPTHGSR